MLSAAAETSQPLPSKLTSVYVAIPAFRRCLPSHCLANGHIRHNIKFRENSPIDPNVITVGQDVRAEGLIGSVFSYKVRNQISTSQSHTLQGKATLYVKKAEAL
jgi:hypothetical protein